MCRNFTIFVEAIQKNLYAFARIGQTGVENQMTLKKDD